MTHRLGAVGDSQPDLRGDLQRCAWASCLGGNDGACPCGDADRAVRTRLCAWHHRHHEHRYQRGHAHSQLTQATYRLRCAANSARTLDALSGFATMDAGLVMPARLSNRKRSQVLCVGAPARARPRRRRRGAASSLCCPTTGHLLSAIRTSEIRISHPLRNNAHLPRNSLNPGEGIARFAHDAARWRLPPVLSFKWQPTVRFSDRSSEIRTS